MRERTPSIILAARVALATLVVAGTVVPAALGGGEPKNDAPFTRPSATNTNVRVITHSARSVDTTVIAGEPKNELPFTRPTAGS